MITQLLFVFGVIVFLAVLAFGWEMQRLRLLRAWMEHHPEARFHEGFVPGEHAGIPAADLVEKIIGRPPIAYASAIEVARPEGALWLVEYRTTPTGAKSSHWFTLVAWLAVDEAVADAAAQDLRRTQPKLRALASGRWVAQSRKGLVTTATLRKLLADFPASA